MNIPDRIYAQYRNSPKLFNWIAIARKMGGDIESAAYAVRKMYDIDTAVGAQLDIIGRIVVVGRSFAGSAPLNPALTGDTDAECGATDQMCSELTIDQDSQLSDELYRLVIKAKIVKNNSDATIDSILRGMNFLLPRAEVLRVDDPEDMTFSVEFYGPITPLERYALLNAKLVPKPQGVRFSGFLEGYQYAQLGDEEAECGNPTAECVGFIGA